MNGAKPQIILIDGNPEAKQVAAGVLDVLFDVVQCNNWGEAREKLVGGLRPEAIVLDINLPCVQGEQTISTVRKVAERIPIIALCDQLDREPVVEYGAADAVIRLEIVRHDWAEALRWSVQRAIAERRSADRFAKVRGLNQQLQTSIENTRQFCEQDTTESWKQKSDPAAIKAN